MEDILNLPDNSYTLKCIVTTQLIEPFELVEMVLINNWSNLNNYSEGETRFIGGFTHGSLMVWSRDSFKQMRNQSPSDGESIHDFMVEPSYYVQRELSGFKVNWMMGKSDVIGANIHTMHDLMSVTELRCAEGDCAVIG